MGSVSVLPDSILGWQRRSDAVDVGINASRDLGTQTLLGVLTISGAGITNGRIMDQPFSGKEIELINDILGDLV